MFAVMSLTSGGSRISSRRGRQLSRGGRQHTILPNFAKNCMKLKEFGPPGGGGRASKILLCRSATAHCTEKHPSPRSMIKLVHYELRTVGKRAVGILLESFLVLQVPTFTNYTGTGLTGSRGRTAVKGSPAPVSSTITNSRPRDSTTS